MTNDDICAEEIDVCVERGELFDFEDRSTLANLVISDFCSYFYHVFPVSLVPMPSEFRNPDLSTTNGGSIALNIFAITPFLITSGSNWGNITFVQVRLLCKAVEVATHNEDLYQYLRIREFKSTQAQTYTHLIYETPGKRGLMHKIGSYH